MHIACCSVAIPRKKRFPEERIQALEHHGLHSSSSPLHDVHSPHQDDALHHIWSRSDPQVEDGLDAHTWLWQQHKDKQQQKYMTCKSTT